MAALLTTRQVAKLVGVETWRVQRLFEDGNVPEPERFGGKRAITSQEVPRIIDALRERGWLESAKEARHVG